MAERNAMIKVLQKHTSGAYDGGASLRNNSSREELGNEQEKPAKCETDARSGGCIQIRTLVFKDLRLT